MTKTPVELLNELASSHRIIVSGPGYAVFSNKPKWEEDYDAGKPEVDTDAETAISHRGRQSEYSQAERDEIVRAWLDKDKNDARTLDVFLVDKFGAKDDDEIKPYPIVALRTFYDWRADYLERHPKADKHKKRKRE